MNNNQKLELVWEGKHDEHGRRVAPLRIALPFQAVETVNEAAQDRQKNLLLEPAAAEGHGWRNRLIWGDKKYVLPSLLPEFAGILSRTPGSREYRGFCSPVAVSALCWRESASCEASTRRPSSCRRYRCGAP